MRVGCFSDSEVVFFALAAVLLHSKVAIVSSGIEGARLWLSLQILEHAQLSPDLGRQMIDPGQSMVVGGGQSWRTRQEDEMR